MSKMRLVIAGAAGRMGRMLIATLHQHADAVVVGALEHAGSAALEQDSGVLAGIGTNSIPITQDALALLAQADGVIDFTTPASTLALADLAAQARIVHVIGTTGLSADDLKRIDAAARHAIIIRSGNMSLGVNMLASLVRRAAQALGEDYDIEIVEMHHKMKVDAPSGTALLLGEAAAQGRKIDLASHSVRVRDGHTGPRPTGGIGFAILRGGTVVGDHSVIFAGPSERIELTHCAEDRGIFARGAVRAALWGRGQKAGHYSMADVLDLT